MSDLVKRLRNYMPDGQDDTIHNEAADRIEELEVMARDLAHAENEAQATIERVKKFPEKWCKPPRLGVKLATECAADLKAALEKSDEV